jgi:IclR family mhp operon transcriptional activator
MLSRKKGTRLDVHEILTDDDETSGRLGTVRAISRALAVLKAINRAGSLTIMGISTAAGIPYATAARIVDTLISEGMVEKEPDRKRYRPTALVQTLSSGYQIENKLIVSCRPHIVALTQKFTWPVAVSTRVGVNIMVRDSTHSLTPLTFYVYHPGYTLPMIESASGRCYLAFCSEDECETVIRGLKGLRYSASNPQPRWDDVALMLSEIRNNGYAIHRRSRYNATPGKTSSIAVPVFAKGHLVGILALSFFASALTMEEALAQYRDPLIAAGKAASRDLDEDILNLNDNW